MTLATILVAIVKLYLALGTAFAVWFVGPGADHLDPVVADGTRGFRTLVVPGTMLLWPYLAYRVSGGRAPLAPREERNAHRVAARLAVKAP